MSDTTTWRKELTEVAKKNGDLFDKLTIAIDEGKLDQEFHEVFGNYAPFFTAWSDAYVYFPAEYDGTQWVESVPRNPCDIKTRHIGGMEDWLWEEQLETNKDA